MSKRHNEIARCILEESHVEGFWICRNINPKNAADMMATLYSANGLIEEILK